MDAFGNKYYERMTENFGECLAVVRHQVLLLLHTQEECRRHVLTVDELQDGTDGLFMVTWIGQVDRTPQRSHQNGTVRGFCTGYAFR